MSERLKARPAVRFRLAEALTSRLRPRRLRRREATRSSPPETVRPSPLRWRS